MRGRGYGVVSKSDCAITIRVGKNPFCAVFVCITQGKFSSIQNVSVIKIAQSRAIVRFLVEHTSYVILAASPLASSGFAAIGDWKGLCPFQTSIYTIF